MTEEEKKYYAEKAHELYKDAAAVVCFMGLPDGEKLQNHLYKKGHPDNLVEMIATGMKADPALLMIITKACGRYIEMEGIPMVEQPFATGEAEKKHRAWRKKMAKKDYKN